MYFKKARSNIFNVIAQIAFGLWYRISKNNIYVRSLPNKVE